MSVIKRYAEQRMGIAEKIPGITVFATGSKEINKRLSQFSATVQKKAMRKATRRGAKVVLAAARRNLIASIGRTKVNYTTKTGRSRTKAVSGRTGNLLRSLTVRALKRSRTRQGHGVAAGSEYDTAKVMAYYGKWLEFGTDIRHHKSGKSVGAIGATKFLRKAIYDNERLIEDVTYDELMGAIRELEIKGAA